MVQFHEEANGLQKLSEICTETQVKGWQIYKIAYWVRESNNDWQYLSLRVSNFFREPENFIADLSSRFLQSLKSNETRLLTFPIEEWIRSHELHRLKIWVSKFVKEYTLNMHNQ